MKVFCSHTRLESIDKIKPNPRNPNTHPQKQIELLAKIISEQGWRTAIGVSKRSGYIVRGHARYEAAKFLGLKEVPIDAQEYKSEKEEMADLIADNRIAELAEMDDTSLKDMLEELDVGDFDMDLTGFDMESLEDFMAGEDGEIEDGEIVAPPEEPKTKRGDVWLLGEHRVMCGDSTVTEDVEKLMRGEKAQLCFTDPPYGVSYASKNEFLNNADKGNRIQEEIKNDHLSFEDTKKLILEAFKNIKNNLDKRGSYYITAPQGGDLLLMMMMMMMEAGLTLRHMLVWVKNNHVLGRTDYNYKHEPILYGWVDRHDFYARGSHQFSTWEIDRPNSSRLHPTMKPLELIENALLNSSKRSDIVIDFFGGSGSTLIACENLKRKCCMMELDERYCDVIVKRWETLTGKEATPEKCYDRKAKPN